MDVNISFSKIVATPNLTSWSQAYNAGKLFAVLSLEEKEGAEIESLNMLGKDLLERLEKEFFIIGNKDLESIKNAISTTFETTPSGLKISFVACALVDKILYLFGFGGAKAYLKRNEKLGIVLNTDDDEEKVVSLSGYVKENDFVVLTTKAFSETLNREELNNSLTNTDPTEISEALAPKIHKAEDGKISAIIIRFNPLVQEPEEESTGIAGFSEEIIDEEGVGLEETITESPPSPEPVFGKYFNIFKNKAVALRLKQSKKIYLGLAVLIVGLLIFSIFSAINEQKNAKARALFAQIYPQALQKYDEGQGLVQLNRNFAKDSFLASQKIIKDNIDKFPKKSKEATQAQELLSKIDKGLSEVSSIDKSGLDRSALSITVTNGSGMEGVAGKAAKILKDFGYDVASTTNADKFTYEGVTIKVKKDKSQHQSLLKKDLSSNYTKIVSSADLDTTFSTDALIIIGK